MRILAISGSLRARSSNSRALAAAALCAPEGMTVSLYDGLGGLPLFNPDLDTESPPEPVLALRQEIGRCDGLLISSPEYARGVAGAMKNALDWLVSSLEFPDKPVLMINASPRAHHADAHMRRTLKTMSARLAGPKSVALPLLGESRTPEEIAADPALAATLRQALDHFAAMIRQAELEDAS